MALIDGSDDGLSGKLHEIGIQMETLAKELSYYGATLGLDIQNNDSAFRFSSDLRKDRLFTLVRSREQSASALPDPELVRRIIKQRQFRKKLFPDDLFADPAWDMTSKISGKSIYFKAAA